MSQWGFYLSDFTRLAIMENSRKLLEADHSVLLVMKTMTTSLSSTLTIISTRWMSSG